MGMFSWLCAVCEKPVLGGSYPGYNKFRKIAVLFADGSRIFGTYSGYGGLDEHGIENLADESDVKLVHRHCYKKQDYDALGPSQSDPDQGFGHPEREMLTLFGEPDLSECSEVTYACSQCHKTFRSKFSRGVCAHGCAPVVCRDHGPQSRAQADARIRRAYDDHFAQIEVRKQQLKQEGLSNDAAHNTAWEEAKAHKVTTCGGCRAQVRETVHQIREDQTMIVCHNPTCFYVDEHRVVDVRDYYEDKEKKIRCGGCEEHNFEVLTLDRSAES